MAAKETKSPAKPEGVKGNKIAMRVELHERHEGKVDPKSIPHPTRSGVTCEVGDVLWLQPNMADHFRRMGFCVYTRGEDTPTGREKAAAAPKAGEADAKGE